MELNKNIEDIMWEIKDILNNYDVKLSPEHYNKICNLLIPVIKTEKEKLYIELGKMSLKTDLWTDFNETDYDNGCKLLDKLRELEK